jgi:hypothetical protein
VNIYGRPGAVKGVLLLLESKGSEPFDCRTAAGYPVLVSVDQYYVDIHDNEGANGPFVFAVS